MQEETMVNQETEEEEVEDLAEETEDDSEKLESALAEEGEEEEAEEDAEPEKPGTRQEPGYVRSRIDKAVQRAVAETESRMRAEFEQQMAPYREHMLTMEAQELVRTGQVKSLETAKELVRYRQGMAQQAAPAEEAPQATDGERDPATAARIDLLSHQADRIRERQGIDVISAFMNDEEVKQKVVSGEWDFYDVAEALTEEQKPRRKPPAPMRSPNGASGAEKSTIASMSDEQFEKLEKKIKGGARYSI